KESHVYVRSECIDVAEGGIAQTCRWSAIMQNFAHLVPAVSHDLKPSRRNRAQFAGMIFHPGFDGRIALDSTIDSKKLRPDHRFTWWIAQAGGPFKPDFGLNGIRETGLDYVMLTSV